MQQWGAERIDELTALVADGRARRRPHRRRAAHRPLRPARRRARARRRLGVVAVGVGRDGRAPWWPRCAWWPCTPSVVVRASATPCSRQPRPGPPIGGPSASSSVASWPSRCGPASTPAGRAGRPRRPPGYVDEGEVRAFAVPSTFRSSPPEGVVVRRAVRDDDVTAVPSPWPRPGPAAPTRWPAPSTTAPATSPSPRRRPTPSGRRGEVSASGATPSPGPTWVGPLVVRPDARRRGVGHALLGQICRDLMIAEFPHAEVHGIADGDSAAEAFLRAAGADQARSYRVLARPLGLAGRSAQAPARWSSRGSR